MGFERFWRGYDWLARGDLAVGWIFDWRKWLWGLVPSGGGMTFLWAAIENRSPLNVWIAAVVVMAALAIFVYFSIVILEKIRPPNILDPLFVGGHSTASSLMTDYQAGKWTPSYPPLKEAWPDFDKWDKRTSFRLFEVACLWTDQEPRLPLTTEAARCFKVLEQAIWDKHLKIRSDNIRYAIANAKIIQRGGEAKANPNWMIEKEPLLLYASGTDQKPRFLFPEERV